MGESRGEGGVSQACGRSERERGRESSERHERERKSGIDRRQRTRSAAGKMFYIYSCWTA